MGKVGGGGYILKSLQLFRFRFTSDRRRRQQKTRKLITLCYNECSGHIFDKLTLTAFGLFPSLYGAREEHTSCRLW